MKKKMILLMAVTLGIFCLSACSGKDRGEGTGDTGQKQESSADVSQFSDIDGTTWQDSWVEKTASGIAVNVDVNVYTTIPDLKRMSVVEVEKYKFNKKNKKEVLEGIFGKEIWYYEADKLPGFVVKKMLQEARETVEYIKKGDLSEKGLQQDLKEAKAQVRQYEDYLKKAPEDFVKLKENDYKGNQYLGERDGIRFRFTFDTSHEYGENASISMTAYDMKEVAPAAMQECAYLGPQPDFGGGAQKSGARVENQCKISKEEAEKEAEDFLQKAGFPDLVKTGEGALMWDGMKENGESVERVSDGWYFNYSQGAEGAAFTDSGYESGGVVMVEQDSGDEAADSDSYYHGYSMKCSARVCVTDKGVVDASWDNPIRILSSVPGVKLLPFEAIKKSIRNQMTEYVEYCYQYRNKKTVIFSNMELVYRRVPDPEDEDKFTYVPAWRLRNPGAFRDVVYFVNAVDGSLIREWDVVWGELKIW